MIRVMQIMGVEADPLRLPRPPVSPSQCGPKLQRGEGFNSTLYKACPEQYVEILRSLRMTRKGFTRSTRKRG
ncbi:hypothetical protein KAW65_09075 [candidate division WOR-3 bacterium]|nr:hypothetical protein [candidate division WOR-3 bacterium]